jgi:hypothetical protein
MRAALPVLLVVAGCTFNTGGAPPRSGDQRRERGDLADDLRLRDVAADARAERAGDLRRERSTSDAARDRGSDRARDAARDKAIPDRAREGLPPDLGCQPPSKLCGSSCVNVKTNAAHCGDCNKPCAAGLDCVGGSCTCIAGGLCSGCCNAGQCLPLATQNAGHCGKGGQVCVACDDKNVCTDDLCSAGACTTKPAAAGTACSDGKHCTISDHCEDGKCTGKNYCSQSQFDSCTTYNCAEPTPPEPAPICIPNGKMPDGTKCSAGYCCNGACCHWQSQCCPFPPIGSKCLKACPEPV